MFNSLWMLFSAYEEQINKKSDSYLSFHTSHIHSRIHKFILIRLVYIYLAPTLSTQLIQTFLMLYSCQNKGCDWFCILPLHLVFALRQRHVSHIAGNLKLLCKYFPIVFSVDKRNSYNFETITISMTNTACKQQLSFICPKAVASKFCANIAVLHGRLNTHTHTDR